jgi:uncharacterized protein
MLSILAALRQTALRVRIHYLKSSLDSSRTCATKKDPQGMGNTMTFLTKTRHIATPLSHWDASRASSTKNATLLCPTKLGIPMHHHKCFLAVNEAVCEYMNDKLHDPSHDYEHIQRVVNLTHHIYTSECSNASSSPGHWTKKVDPMVMYLTAMMHDIGKAKYLLENDHRTVEDHIQDLLKPCNVPTPVARQVEYLVPRVSFTREANDRELVKTECRDYPELAVVQDADRLDGLGTVGLGRCFVCGGVDQLRRDQTIHGAMQMFHKRFAFSVEWMKTNVGKAEAEKRWKKMQRFLEEWNKETNISAVV